VGVPDAGFPPGGRVCCDWIFPCKVKGFPSQSGLLLMYRDGKPGREADAIRVLH